MNTGVHVSNKRGCFIQLLCCVAIYEVLTDRVLPRLSSHAPALLQPLLEAARYVTCSTQQGVRIPSEAKERLKGRRTLKELFKINKYTALLDLVLPH
jgi:hypothetical protein